MCVCGLITHLYTVKGSLISVTGKNYLAILTAG